MKRFICLFLLLCCNSSYANWFQDIIDCINKQAAISNGMMGNQLALSSSMLSTEQDMQKLLDHLNDHVLAMEKSPAMGMEFTPALRHGVCV